MLIYCVEVVEEDALNDLQLRERIKAVQQQFPLKTYRRNNDGHKEGAKDYTPVPKALQRNKPAECGWCGRTIQRKDHLKRHQEESCTMRPNRAGRRQGVGKYG